jgi:hypothetical protein
VKLESLYLLRFGYPDGWTVEFDADTDESAHLYFAEGRAEGAITGRFRAANHPRQRGDGTFEPDLHGVIETDDGGVLLVDMHGYGRAYPAGRRQVVVAIKHSSNDPPYRRLNDGLCVGTGEVRAVAGGSVEIVVEIAEVIWEAPNGQGAAQLTST